MTDHSGGANKANVGQPHISVIGVGGAGGNAVDNMIRAKLEGVAFMVANTDAQAMGQSLCQTQIQLGINITKGLGAGGQPEIGQAAAEEAIEAIAEALSGANMAFITAGMGGGTGTGGAPVIARAAREAGVLTVGVVTKPFHFEGARRMRQAEAGIGELAKHVDTLIVIPNQNLFRVATEKTTFADAFKLADEVLHSGVRGVTDLIVLPGLVNLDFADIRAVMAGMGKAVMGTGEAEGDDRALAAAEAAITNPLLDDISVKGARSVLLNITGGRDLMLHEVDEAASRIREEVDPEANIIFGSAFDDTLEGKMRVSVIATGSDLVVRAQSTPTSGRPFVGPRSEVGSSRPTTQIRAAHAASAAPADEPLTLRLVSSLPVELPRSAQPATAESESSAAAADGAAATANDQDAAVDLASLAADSRFDWNASESEQPVSEHNGAAAAANDQAGDAAAPQPSGGRLRAKFHRPAKPVKSESVSEATQAVRPQAEPADAAAGKTHYVVWEIDLGARIYKVPAEKVASVRRQPHADRLKLFDSLDGAKAEVNAIFKRVADERSARGLPMSILQPTLNDIMRWNEEHVPNYFL